MGLGKDLGAQYAAASPAWAAAQQRSHPAMSPGTPGPTMGRSQGSPMDPMVMKRPQLYGMGTTPTPSHSRAAHTQEAPTVPQVHSGIPLACRAGLQGPWEACSTRSSRCHCSTDSKL